MKENEIKLSITASAVRVSAEIPADPKLEDIENTVTDFNDACKNSIEAGTLNPIYFSLSDESDHAKSFSKDQLRLFDYNMEKAGEVFDLAMFWLSKLELVRKEMNNYCKTPKGQKL